MSKKPSCRPKILKHSSRSRSYRTAANKLAEIQQQQHEAHQQVVANQARLALELMPEWSDPEVLDREREGIVQTALASGFTTDEINSISDARFFAGAP